MKLVYFSGVAVVTILGLTWYLRSRAATAEQPDGGVGQFLGPQGTPVFLDKLHADLGKRGLQYRMTDEGIEGLIGENARLGLSNLAIRCQDLPESAWAGAIKEHFDLIIDLQEEEERLERNANDFDSVREMLGIQLYPPEYLPGGVSDHIVSRVDIPDVLTVLVYDLSSGVGTVQRENAVNWGRSDEELFRIAAENTFKRCELERMKGESDDDPKRFWITGDNIFTAAQVLSPDVMKRFIGDHGAIVGIPTRHLITCAPIDGVDIIESLQSFIAITDMAFERMEKSITNNIYWYRNGMFTRLPYELTDEGLKFMPPDEFIDLMNRLAEPEGKVEN